MEWKQIETKWAAMTRRIRAAYVSDRIEPSRGSTRDPARIEARTATIADGMSVGTTHPEFKSSSK